MKINQTGNMYDFISGIMVFYPRYLIGVYPIISQQSLLIKQTSEEFFPNTNTILTEIKEMTYDTNNQLSYEKNQEAMEVYKKCIIHIHIILTILILTIRS